MNKNKINAKNSILLEQILKNNRDKHVSRGNGLLNLSCFADHKMSLSYFLRNQKYTPLKNRFPLKIFFFFWDSNSSLFLTALRESKST